MQQDPVLVVLHELAHAAALNAHPGVENAFIRSEADAYCVGTHDVPPEQVSGSREQAVRLLASGIVAEWLYRFRDREDPPLAVAALFWGRLDLFCTAQGAYCDAKSLEQVMHTDHQQHTQTIYELGRMLWPLVAGCDESVCRETYAQLKALPVGAELAFDTGAGLLALAGVKQRRVN